MIAVAPWWRQRVPLALKMLLLVAVSLPPVWLVFGYFQSQGIRQPFNDHLTLTVDEQAWMTRLQLDDYLRSQIQLIRLLVHQQQLVSHVRDTFSSESRTTLRRHLHPQKPDWLPRYSTIHDFTLFSHILLLDQHKRPREMFSTLDGDLNARLPELVPEHVDRRVRNGLVFLEGVHYLLTSTPLPDQNERPLAYLVLITPMDTPFLVAFQHRIHHQRGVITFIDEQTERVISSSRPTMVAEGSLLSTLEKDYLIRENTFLDYAFSSGSLFRLAILTPRRQMEEITEHALKQGRKYELMTVSVLLLVLVMVLVWVSSKLNRFHSTVLGYTRERLGTEPPVPTQGDKLYLLEELFRHLISQIGQSWASLELELAARKKTEHELQIHRDQLEKLLEEMVESRTRELQASKERLEKEVVERKEAHAALARLAAELQASKEWLEKEIAERKKANAALALLGAAIEQTADLVMITDISGSIRYVNPAFLRLTGFEKEDLLGQDVEMLRNPHHGPDYYEKIYRTINAGRAWKDRLVLVGVNEGTWELDTIISPVRNENNAITNYVAVARDITKERQLERQLRQAQKLEAIGTLSGGIAHDFNNILAAILSYTELTMDEVPEESLAHQNLQEVVTASLRARDLIQSLLTFSRRNEGRQALVSLRPVIKEAAKLLRAGLKPNIRMDIDLEQESNDHVLGDPTEIHQVIMNLGTNAAQAMEEKGGVLQIKLESLHVDDIMAARHASLGIGPYWLLSVTDSGEGIQPKYLDHIFEPFFTTKEVGKGTGLGLSVVHGIVRKHDGDIVVASRPGMGTTFRVYLPRPPQ